MYSQSSHIKMFGHLALNHRAIFHICHGPHILPLPAFPPPPLSPDDLFSPYLEPVLNFAYFLLFPGHSLFISGWLSFWIEPDQFTARHRYSLCVRWRREAARGMRRVCFMMAIVGTPVLFPALFLWCYHSHSHDSTVLLALERTPGFEYSSYCWHLFFALWSAVALQYVHPCIYKKNENATLEGVPICFNEGMTAYSGERNWALLYLMIYL